MPFPPTCPPADWDARIAAQQAAIAELERALWQDGLNTALLAPYQAAFRTLEALIAARGGDHRHGFVIVIPVADSPVHLRNCLNSLLQLCETFGYGGQTNGRWSKVAVLLADDSGDPRIIDENREIARAFDRLGLTTHYFGLEEQLALLHRLVESDAQAGAVSSSALSSILGSHRHAAFHHKGQAMMRNLAYLKLAELYAEGASWLFYTIDADQAFKVKVAAAGEEDVMAVNFFYRLDEIFSQRDIQVLTGKVVGDPPVSPAVMAGNFMEDVIAFLQELAPLPPQAAYRQPALASGGDAAYHDMADLFGFKQAAAPYRYRCPLPGMPDNAACLAEFARRLSSFFHGEHPTRITWFEYQEALASVQPARTVYTGNYVFRRSALHWFIPFAPLRLRMSGPTMGRLLRAELGERFVSANLPMLHKRTVLATGASEFRPGIVAEAARIDLCGEFERQFHGDVMLFAMQRLITLGYPQTSLTDAAVGAVLDGMRAELREKYRLKQATILAHLARLQALLEDAANWWTEGADLREARACFQMFIDNMAGNFGEASPCYARIDAAGTWEQWRARQLAALQGFMQDRAAWRAALAKLSPGAAAA